MKVLNDVGREMGQGASNIDLSSQRDLYETVFLPASLSHWNAQNCALFWSWYITRNRSCLSAVLRSFYNLVNYLSNPVSYLKRIVKVTNIHYDNPQMIPIIFLYAMGLFFL